MKMKRGFLNRTMAFALVLTLLVPFLPAFDLEAEAAPEGMNYVSLPITIRDYADDGMLFEYSDIGIEGTKEFTVGGTSATPNYRERPTYKTNVDVSDTTEYVAYKAIGDGSTYSSYVTWAVGQNYTRNQLRYMVLTYRTNSAVASGQTPVIYHRVGSANDGVKVAVPTTGYNKSSFQTVIVDLGGGTGKVGHITFHFELPKNKTFYLKDAAFFGSRSDAESYKNNTESLTYHMGNNLHYGLLMGNTGTMHYADAAFSNTSPVYSTNNDGSGTMDQHMESYLGKNMIGGAKSLSTNINKVNLSNSSTADDYTGLVWSKLDEFPGVGDYLDITLENGAKQQLYGGRARIGLVEPVLDGKNIVYNKETVDYIAWTLSETLPIPEKNSDGTYNFSFIQGTKLADLGNKDLATVLRESITGGMGTYADAKTKFNGGGLVHPSDCTTYYEAAYFLLHSTFKTNAGYGKELNNPYHELQLLESKNAAGEVCYKFSSAYSNTDYDAESGIICNTQLDEAPDTGATWAYGMKIYKNHFNPIPNDGYGITGSRYLDLNGYEGEDWHEKYNYHLSLEGHAQFIFREDANQYFTFTGDDDVYLFINGHLVLDLGGAHAIAEMTVDLNDVANICGLTDGKAYDFDFYYMERHGTAANFSIETNIQIVDPAMVTGKTAYQNQVEVGYNGFVNPALPVSYAFTLENSGAAPIVNLEFDDPILSTKLTKDSITLNSETQWDDLLVALYNADGSVKELTQLGELTEAKLKEYLANGLLKGEKIQIYGFKYTVPTGKWAANSDGTYSFPNTVYTKSAVTVSGTTVRELTGQADYVVRKQNVTIDGLHLYSWGKNVVQDDGTIAFNLQDGGVSLTYAEAIAPITAAYAAAGLTAPNLTGGTLKITNASGNAGSSAVNPRASVTADGITHAAAGTGTDTYYYTVEKNSVIYGPVSVAVYTYAVSDNVYVLDYGLAVELNDDTFGFRANDVLTNIQNPYSTVIAVEGLVSPTANYGDFVWADPSLTYTPDKIMNNTDSTGITVTVKESGAASVTKFTGVTMSESITTAPASVVYYEDNFPGITYVNGDGNNWVQYETVDAEGNKIVGTEQSADQNSNYGSDPNYAEDKSGLLVDDFGNVLETDTFVLDTTSLDALQQSGVDFINQYLDQGDASNGTIRKLEVKKTAEVMHFEFEGTGFEILSRTTGDQYAVIDVSVQRKDTQGNWEEVTYKPVITESKGGDLYQVPVISITGLDHDLYRVVVTAAGERTYGDVTISRILFIDGIRIYGPLEDNEALEYYNPEEYRAEFIEVKQLIDDEKAIYASTVLDDAGVNYLIAAGDTVIEDTDDSGFVLRKATSVKEYMDLGPNNELYFDPSNAEQILAFFITPDATVPAKERTVEIGAHRKADSASNSNGYVYLVYGSNAEDIVDGTYGCEIVTGTEQYYTVDVDNLTLDADGRYLVLVGVNASENYAEVMALTNLKIKGYTIDFAAVEAELSNILDEEEGGEEQSEVTKYMKFAAPRTTLPTEPVPGTEEPTEEPTEPEGPAVNENLTVDNAALKAPTVASGKNASLAVKSGTLAAEIILRDAEGNRVEFNKVNRTEKDGVVTFMVVFTVAGERGAVLDYTVQLVDAEGAVSANTETVSVTIK